MVTSGKRQAFGTLALTAALWGSPAPSHAAPILYDVTLDTSTLAAAGMHEFALAFQFLDGGGPANTATLSNFFFGGGSATSGTATLEGGAAGDLATGITLTDAASFFSSFQQTFTAGSVLRFNMLLSDNFEPDPLFSPDALSMSVLFRELTGDFTSIPTTFGDALFLISMGERHTIETFASADPWQLPAPQVSAVPEPGTLLLFGTGIAMAIVRRRRRTRTSDTA